MKEHVFNEAKKLFIEALCRSGIDEKDISINFDSELADEDGVYSFLLSVEVEPYRTDEGLCTPKPIIFQVDKVDDEEAHFIVGEDTETAITYGNVFAYMYFSSLEVNCSEKTELENRLKAINDEEPIGYIRESDQKMMQVEETSCLVYSVKMICADGDHYGVPVFCAPKMRQKNQETHEDA